MAAIPKSTISQKSGIVIPLQRDAISMAPATEREQPQNVPAPCKTECGR